MVILLIEKMFTNHNSSLLKQHTVLVVLVLACHSTVV